MSAWVGPGSARAERRQGNTASPGRGLPRPGGGFADVLTVLTALMLIRIEDLGGAEAMAELVRRVKDPAELPLS